jgi:hypothetical protein
MINRNKELHKIPNKSAIIPVSLEQFTSWVRAEALTNFSE